jgi:putative phage-type endonuclease
MTFYELPDIEQGSDEWHEQRRGMVTASIVGQLITPATIKPANNPESRGIAAMLAAERITGYTEPTYVSEDMMRGHEVEPRAVEVYSEHYAPVTTTGFMIRDDYGFQLGYSPDGLVGEDGLIEIKSRRQKKHLQTILADEVPRENMAQIQCGLLVSGREWCDYVSYCGGMPMWRKRVTLDQKWREAIIIALTAFEVAVASIIADYNKAVEGLPMTERVIEQEIVI